ncbi:MAG: hypothetical protein JXR89_04675 [Deltaproteobacteria bacterium]|nr:hypothetical protein [Deltaproteobacteria bacterium]
MPASPTPYICPVSNLPITSLPEWNRVSFGGEFEISIDIIGDHIILTHNHGTPNFSDVKGAMKLIDSIIEERLTCPYICISNYSAVNRNISLESRRYVIKQLKQRQQMLAAVYYGVNPGLKLSIRIGCFFNMLPFRCLIRDSYTEAVETALAILAERRQDHPVPEEIDLDLEQEASSLVDDLASARTPDSEFDPFTLALELLEDEVSYLDEKTTRSRQLKTMERLQQIIASRNNKAAIYRHSLRPGKKQPDQPKTRKDKDNAGNSLP